MPGIRSGGQEDLEIKARAVKKIILKSDEGAAVPMENEPLGAKLLFVLKAIRFLKRLLSQFSRKKWYNNFDWNWWKEGVEIQMIRAMIIEDHSGDAEFLQGTLLQLQPQFTFVRCSDGQEALTYLNNLEQNIDIFFIDCVLPRVDGFTLAGKIRNLDGYLLVPIIFVTGYNMNPLDAFQEYHCYSFLQKPFTAELMRKSIGPLLESLTLKEERKQKSIRKVINLVAREGETYTYAEDILALEIIGRDCVVYTRDQEYHLSRVGLVKKLKEIDEPYIVRCHKSFAINLLHISGVKRKGRNLWTPIFKEDCDFDCDISKTYYDQVMMKFKELLDR